MVLPRYWELHVSHCNKYITLVELQFNKPLRISYFRDPVLSEKVLDYELCKGNFEIYCGYDRSYIYKPQITKEVGPLSIYRQQM